MKNALLTLLCYLCCLQLFADEQTIIPNLKFGKPTMEELTMTTYAPDSNATAVILCKLTNVSYKWGLESFRLVSEYKVNAARKSKVDDNTARMQSIKQLGV
nr:hypothetical protein [Bacteroides intestinalis]